MQGCKYSKVLKCQRCEHSLHRECKKFILARAKELSIPLQPFVYSSKYKPTGQVVWAKDANRAKSAALQYAVKLNMNIKKYTASQVISLALNGETVEGSVVYIECASKITGDVDKFRGVIISFIESALLNNTRFVLYVAPTIPLTFEYTRL